jgi:hypothetical protein
MEKEKEKAPKAIKSVIKTPEGSYTLVNEFICAVEKRQYTGEPR